MQKNGVKMQERMDSKQEGFLNLRLNLSMTRFMLNPTESNRIQQNSKSCKISQKKESSSIKSKAQRI